MRVEDSCEVITSVARESEEEAKGGKVEHYIERQELGVGQIQDGIFLIEC